MELSSSLPNVAKIEESGSETRRISECFCEIFQTDPKIRQTKWSSESDLTKNCSYDIAVESMKRNSLEEMSKCMRHRLDAETEQILNNGEVADENSLKNKTYLMNMFRTAVLKVMKEPSAEENEDSLAPLRDNPTTNLALLPTRKTKAIYLSQIFKYAVKQTIIDQRQEKSSGDPWEEFFFRIYSAERPQIENVKQRHGSGAIKLNLSKEIQEKLNVTDYDSSVKDKLIPHKPSSSTRGKRELDNFSRISSSITKRRQKDLNEKGGDEHLSQHATLPKMPPLRRGTNQRGREFRVERVRHSPDGRSPLSRLFYLPHISSQSASFKN